MEGIAFVKDQAVEITGGVVHLKARSGDMRLEFAMSARNFARLLDRGARALKRHAAGDENIVVDD